MSKFCLEILKRSAKTVIPYTMGFISAYTAISTPSGNFGELTEMLTNNIEKGVEENITPRGEVLKDNLLSINITPKGKIITDETLKKGDIIDILETHENGEDITQKYYKDEQVYFVLSNGVSNKIFARSKTGAKEYYNVLLWKS